MKHRDTMTMKELREFAYGKENAQSLAFTYVGAPVRLQKLGCKGYAKLAFHFDKAADVDRALGLSPTSNAYFRGAVKPGPIPERAACLLVELFRQWRREDELVEEIAMLRERITDDQIVQTHLFDGQPAPTGSNVMPLSTPVKDQVGRLMQAAAPTPEPSPEVSETVATITALSQAGVLDSVEYAEDGGITLHMRQHRPGGQKGGEPCPA